MSDTWKKYSLAQQVMVPLAALLLILSGRTRSPSLILLALSLGVAVMLLWIWRKRTEEDLYKRAILLAEQGELAKSLALLMSAEEAWALNQVHSTPRTMAKDFRRFAAVVAAIQDQSRKLGAEIDCGEILQATTRLVEICTSRKNVAFGTNSLKRRAYKEIEQTLASFRDLRGRLRAACGQLSQTLVQRSC